MKSLSSFINEELVAHIYEAKQEYPELIKNAADKLYNGDDMSSEEAEALIKFFNNMEFKPKKLEPVKRFMEMLIDAKKDIETLFDYFVYGGKKKDKAANKLEQATQDIAYARGWEDTDLLLALNALFIHLWNDLNPKEPAKVDSYKTTIISDIYVNCEYLRDQFTDKRHEAEQAKRLSEYPEVARKFVPLCDNICSAGAWNLTKPRIYEKDFEGFWEAFEKLDTSKMIDRKWNTANGELVYTLEDGWKLALAMHNKESKDEVIKLLDHYRTHGNGDPWFTSLCVGVQNRYKAYAASMVDFALSKGAAEYFGWRNSCYAMGLTTEQIRKELKK